MADEDDPRKSEALERGAKTSREEPPQIQAPRPTPARSGRAAKVFRLAATAVIVICAFVAAVLVWQYYVTAPWTRNGTVRVQVANIAPQVAGQITAVKVVDNQTVQKGDVLYVIDPFDFQVNVAAADAELKNREADLSVKNAQSARRQALTTVSTSVEEKQQYAGTAKIAQAALESAKAQLSQAKINLERTEVKSTVNGRVTNLLMRVGDYARTGTANIQVIDTDSFWMDGYFEETKMANIHVGDPVEMALMSYAPTLRGRVESITLGISTSNATAGTQGLPNVDPIYTWVRLAQRVPVRVHIDEVPPGIELVAGMTATIAVGADGGMPPPPRWFVDLRRKLFGEPVPGPAGTTQPNTPAAVSSNAPQSR